MTPNLPPDIHPPAFTILAEQTWATYRRIHCGYRHTAPPPLPPNPPILFSQHDPQWADLHLGTSPETITTAGCAVTAAAMLASTIDHDLNPATFTAWLNKNQGFTSGGLLRWNKVAEHVPGLEFIDYHLWRNAPADVDKLRSLLDYGPQIVQVDYHPGGPLNTHFLLATAFITGTATNPDDLATIDPFTGKTGTLLTTYAGTGWNLARAVYAIAEYRTLQSPTAES